MRRGHVVETRRDRTALAHDAGLGKLSLTSALAGMLCAFGSFAVLAAIAGAVLRATGVDSTNDISGDWREVGIGTGVVLALVLFLSYLFGGYVAGRMARRAGALNGLMVFVLGVLVVAGVGAAVSTQTDTETVMDNLRSIGVPTSGDEWAAIGSIAGAVALLGMLLGSILGGILGERWHGKLVARALDPTIGPEVDLRDRDRDGRVDTLDEDRSSMRDRTLVSSGRGTEGAHFAGRDRDGDGRTGLSELGDRDDTRRDDVDWDGSNRTRRIDSTSSTLDEDLNRHN